MKKALTVFLFMIFLQLNPVSAQNPVYANGISVSGLIVDYTSPFSGNSPFKEIKVYDFENVGIGGEIKYTRFLHRFFAIGVPLKIAQVNLPQADSTFTDKELVLSLDGQLQFGYFPDESRFKPFLFSGMGVNMNGPENDINLQLPVGLGINIRLVDQLHLQIHTEYRHSFTANRNNWQHGAGLLYTLDGERDKKAANKSAKIDTDGDGVADVDDNCPNDFGVAAFSGCPDTDRDGIGDFEDDCPNLAGLLEFNGCPDTDGDGVSNRDDDCPDFPGLIEMKGCPDGDGDGVSDALDSCPEQPGPADNNGCPTIQNDRDDDGVVDDLDDCPTEPGLARFAGCPDKDADGIPDKDDPCPLNAGRLNGCPDTDGDGIADDADRCPSQPGVLANNGCPEQTPAPEPITIEDQKTLERATYGVKFETGSARLISSSNSILNQIADIMNRYPAYYLKIGGHTDSIGSSADNQKLSEKRAKACYSYLVQRGVSRTRMEFRGFGEKQPVANNKYKDGREKNRRVEFDLNPQ